MTARNATYLERAIRSAAEDTLERQEFAERLGKALVAHSGSRATGVVVGLCGEWGSGKSSILNLVAEHLEKDRNTIVVSFDPWMVSGRDDLVMRLLAQVAKQLKANSRTTKAGESLLSYIDSLSPVVGLAAALAGAGPLGAAIGGAVGGSAKFLKEFIKAPDIRESRAQLDRALIACNTPIVVMIDELDRLDDSEIRAMAQFVRAVGDFDHISYLLAYDQKRIAEALGADGGGNAEEKLKRGTAYLEKIVQYQIALPLAFKGELQRLVRGLLETVARDVDLPEGWDRGDRCKELFDILIPGILATPRDLKRFAGMIHVQASMLGEVDLLDLMGWCALQTKAPRTVQRIKERPSLVGGPQVRFGEYEEPAPSAPEDRLTSVVPEGESSKALSYLLHFLFPYLAKAESAGRSPDCICFDRPLLTVLRNGVPPGHYSRADIVAFLTGEKRTASLAAAANDDSLRVFVARVGELYPAVPRLKHVAIWRDVAHYIERDTLVWPTEHSQIYGLGKRFVSAVLTSFPEPHKLTKIFSPVCEALRQAEDWNVLPVLLEHQLWSHGLYNRPASASHLPFLTAEQTEAASNTMSARLITAVMNDREFLRRLREIAPLRIALQSGQWTTECRQKLTQSLDRPEVLDALVLLLFGGTQTANATFANRLFDLKTFAAAVNRRGPEIAKTDLDSLKEAYSEPLLGQPVD